MGDHGSRWPKKRLKMTRSRRVTNTVMERLVSWNLVPHTVMLTTVGRKSGQPHRVPVTPIERNGRRYLVAPYGPVAWVHNARAAGEVTLSGKKMSGRYAVREVPAHEAGPVLQAYVRLAPQPRPYFSAARDAPVEAFVAEAHAHPVFEITPVAAG